MYDSIFLQLQVWDFHGSYEPNRQCQRLIGAPASVPFSQFPTRLPQFAQDLRPIVPLTFAVIAEAHNRWFTSSRARTARICTNAST